MKTVKELREAIENKTLSDDQLTSVVKFYAENIERLALGECVAFKQYILKGAEFLNIAENDLKKIFILHLNKHAMAVNSGKGE